MIIFFSCIKNELNFMLTRHEMLRILLMLVSDKNVNGISNHFLNIFIFPLIIFFSFFIF